MAQQTNQTQAQMMCSTGCGFYGNPRTGGMCSVCYKEHLQRRGGRSTPPAASPSGSPGPPAVTMEMDLAVVSDPVTPSGETRATISVTRQISKMSLDRDTTDQDDAEEKAGTSSKITDAATDESQVPSDGEQTPDKSKKNRCFTCRKKVGLTGFDCRCGNLFCGIHRYSDKHDCPYDYRGAAVAQIRKENPMVMAEKIQKL